MDIETAGDLAPWYRVINIATGELVRGVLAVDTEEGYIITTVLDDNAGVKSGSHRVRGVWINGASHLMAKKHFGKFRLELREKPNASI